MTNESNGRLHCFSLIFFFNLAVVGGHPAVLGDINNPETVVPGFNTGLGHAKHVFWALNCFLTGSFQF